MQVLEVVDGQGRRRHVALDRPRLVIGREPTCDIHLPHPGVSRRHAQLQCTDQGRWLLQDLSSRNHVYLENRPVQQFVIEPRKPFRIAEYWLALVEPAEKPGEPEPPPPSLDDTAETALGLEAPWLENLQAFQRSLASLDEPHLILEGLAREVRRVLRPKIIAVGVTKPDGYVWEIVQTEDDSSPLKDSLAEADKKVAEEESSIHTWAPSYGKNGKTGTNVPTSNGLNMLVPMKGRLGVIGHVYVSRPAYTAIAKPLQRYLALLGSYAGMSYDNLHLGRLRQAQLEIEKELQHARQIQIDLFPPTFDVDPRLDCYAVNLPSAKVSGDYYDLIAIGPDTVAFVIADAMGHGMPAALLMAAVRAGLRMGLSMQLPWTNFFKGVDGLIRQAQADTFVTGMVGLLDLAAGELQIVSAGHPSPSILIDGVPVKVPECCLTRPWGIDLETSWEVGRINLKGKSWSILCYTDGVTDGAARSQRTSGAQRLAKFHLQNQHLGAEDLCEALLSELATLHGPGSLADDQTILVLRSA